MANGEVEGNGDRGPVAETRDVITELRRSASKLKVVVNRDPSATKLIQEMAEHAVVLASWMQDLYGNDVASNPLPKIAEIEALQKATEEIRDASERVGQEPPRGSHPTKGTVPS